MYYVSRLECDDEAISSIDLEDIDFNASHYKFFVKDGDTGKEFELSLERLLVNSKNLSIIGVDIPSYLYSVDKLFLDMQSVIEYDGIRDFSNRCYQLCMYPNFYEKATEFKKHPINYLIHCLRSYGTQTKQEFESTLQNKADSLGVELIKNNFINNYSLADGYYIVYEVNSYFISAEVPIFINYIGKGVMLFEDELHYFTIIDLGYLTKILSEIKT